MEYPVYYSSSDNQYYVSIFIDGDYNYFIEKNLEEYEDVGVLWNPSRIHKNTFQYMVDHYLTYITELEVDDSYVANYMLLY